MKKDPQAKTRIRSEIRLLWGFWCVLEKWRFSEHGLQCRDTVPHGEEGSTYIKLSQSMEEVDSFLSHVADDIARDLLYATDPKEMYYTLLHKRRYGIWVLRGLWKSFSEWLYSEHGTQVWLSCPEDGIGDQYWELCGVSHLIEDHYDALRNDVESDVDMDSLQRQISNRVRNKHILGLTKEYVSHGCQQD